MKLVERLREKVAEGNEDQDSAESHQSWTSPKSNQQQGPRGELDQGHYGPCRPQRPYREKGLRVRPDEPTLSMLDRTEGEHLPKSSHEKDQAENDSGDENRPAAVLELTEVHSSRAPL